jgi:transposase
MRAGGKKADTSSYSYESLKAKTKEELIRLILQEQDIKIPVTVFSAGLPPLTALVKYLHDEKKLAVREIALKLGRHEQTIWTILRKGKDERLVVKECEVLIPVSLFSKEKFSILETLTNFLLTDQQMTLSQIAKVLDKSIKTIWTCSSRYKTKGETNG